MRIEFSKQLPSIKELTETLKLRFPNPYSIRTFGLGRKNILIGKSTLVGAEISINQNTVSIAYSPPSVFGGFLITLGLTEFAILLFPFLFKEGFSHNASYRKLEKDIGTFLKQKFS